MVTKKLEIECSIGKGFYAFINELSETPIEFLSMDSKTDFTLDCSLYIKDISFYNFNNLKTLILSSK